MKDWNFQNSENVSQILRGDKNCWTVLYIFYEGVELGYVGYERYNIKQRYNPDEYPVFQLMTNEYLRCYSEWTEREVRKKYLIYNFFLLLFKLFQIISLSKLIFL